MSLVTLLAIETLGDRVLDLERQRDAYRELAFAAVEELQRKDAQLRRARQQCIDLREELRGRKAAA